MPAQACHVRLDCLLDTPSYQSCAGHAYTWGQSPSQVPRLCHCSRPHARVPGPSPLASVGEMQALCLRVGPDSQGVCLTGRAMRTPTRETSQHPKAIPPQPIARSSCLISHPPLSPG